MSVHIISSYILSEMLALAKQQTVIAHYYRMDPLNSL